MTTLVICLVFFLAIVIIVRTLPDNLYIEKGTGAVYQLKDISFVLPDIIYELQNRHTGEVKKVTKEYFHMHFKEML